MSSGLAVLDPASTPWIVGHRGAAGEAPENTLASYRLAVAQGVDMVEADVQLTRDGQLVAFHDWELPRLTGSSGVVEESTLAELSSLRVLGGDATPAYSIPSFREVLSALPPRLPLNIELKRRAASMAEIASCLAATLTGDRPVLVSSFDWPLLAAIRTEFPNVPVAPLGRDDPEDLLRAAEEIDAWAVHCRHSLATAELVSAAAAQGRPVLVYTVNDPVLADRLSDLGVAGFFTDFPRKLREHLEAQ